MLSRFLPAGLVGSISLLLYIINTLFWAPLIFVMALVKLLIPLSAVTKGCNIVLNFFASRWIWVNQLNNSLCRTIHWKVSIPDNLSTKQWYLVIANHQGWADILVLQQIFNGKIPFLKFFLKQQLFWVPVLGLAWWALDFPFMKRFTKSYIKKNPHMKGKDFETTKKACEKFKSIPISVMNFAEGTRFTEAKHAKQDSPFTHLLKPKAGGIGYVLTLMGDEINQLVNVTINYPNNKDVDSWDFLCGRIKTIEVYAELVPIPQEVKGDYIADPENRKRVQQWLNKLWLEKDEFLKQSA